MKTKNNKQTEKYNIFACSPSHESKTLSTYFEIHFELWIPTYFCYKNRIILRVTKLFQFFFLGCLSENAIHMSWLENTHSNLFSSQK